MTAEPSSVAPPQPTAPTPPSIVALQGKAPLGVPARVTHNGEEGDLRFAVVPLPTYPTPANTLAQRKGAISVSYAGRLAEAVDLYRQTVLQDGFFDGILRTMAEGILQLPLSFAQGTPEMCSALLNADGTAGDWAAMHPLEECGQIFKDGLMGFPGLGQYLLRCWRCGYTDHDRVMAELAVGVGGSGTFEVCKRCGARRDERPIGQRELFRLEWRDCRWLDQNPVTFQWYYQGRSGRIPMTDGDGEWFMFFTTPRLESWRHGIWIWATLYALFSRDAMYDSQNTSQVTAPTPVLSAKKPVPEATRAAAEQRIRQLGFDNRIVLNGEWDYEIVSAKAEYKDICTDIVNRCSDAFETGVTGNVMGRAARTAFTDAGIYHRTTAERRGAAADLWMRQTREKGLVHWGRDNFGTREVPVGCLDVRSPEDKLKAAQALEQLGKGLKGLVEGLAAVSREVTPAWVQETMQTAGIRTQAVSPRSKLIFDPKDRAGYVLMDEARESDDLPPLPVGDPRKLMMVAAALKAGGPSAPVGATPEAAPTPGDALAAPPPPPPADARLEEDDLDEEEEEDRDDEDTARLAVEMTQYGLDRCEHDKLNRCRLCGVERVRGVALGADGRPNGWRVAWRVIKRPGPPAAARLGPSRAAPSTLPLESAEAQLDAALDALDDLYDDDADEDERARRRARVAAREQERGPDGRFLAGGGAGKSHDDQGRAITTSPGTKDGLGRSKAAVQARKDSAAAKAATASAKTGGSHADAAKAHLDAAAQHRAAATASARADYRAAHEAAAKAHEDVAAAHQAEHAAAPPTEPTPEQLAAAVKASVDALPRDDLWMTRPADVRAGVMVADAHIQRVLHTMPKKERSACMAFTNGHDHEIRALERGVGKADLIASRMSEKRETEKVAVAHVEKSARLVAPFHAALDRLATTRPPPPAIMRGMSASDRTLHALLTRDTFSTSGMSSSASLEPAVAWNFSRSAIGKRDYLGEKCTHPVIFKIDRARTAPIMHRALGHFAEEAEVVLRRDATYRITGRSRDHDRVIIHMSEE